MNHSAQAFLMFVILLVAQLAHGDHVLLDDGRVLYNITVPDRATTGTTLVRVRTGSNSFGYDPKSNTVFALPGYSSVHRISDYIKSSESVGRAQATAIVQQRQWDRYVAPVERQVLVAPLPSQKATPVAAGPAQSTPVPFNVVSDSLPLDERLAQQLDLFIKEQTLMAQDATTSMARGLATMDQARGEKVRLLQQQKLILQQFFPQTTDTVRLAVEYWGQQADRASQTGKFDVENL